MRVAGFIIAIGVGLALTTGDWPATAQDGGQKSKAGAPKATTAAPKTKAAAQKGKPAAQKKQKSKKAAAKPANPPPHLGAREFYEALPAADRVAVQSDLAWVGAYNGLIDGDFNERSIAAVQEFQKRLKNKPTGILNPQERGQLAAAARGPQEEVGWRLVNDPTSGTRLGVPSKLAPETGKGRSGGRWFSQQGQIQIETFRLRGTALAAAFEREKKEPPQRRVAYSVLRDGYFVVTGLQGLKKFYVRAYGREGEVRGFTLLYDQATEGTMDAVAVAMSNAFQPFPAASAATAGPPARRKVDYGTAIVASSAGHLVTDREVVDDCQVIVVPGHGAAERLADDRGNGLALVRLYGAANLVPMPLTGGPADGAGVTLVGIADPQAQAGGRAVTTPAARLSGNNGIAPPPQPGFAGAAALDAQGRFVGMVTMRPAVVAGANANGAPQAGIVPADAVRTFLQANKVAGAPARVTSANDGAKASVLRVICVRK
jgi:peptidoglycan hydrolase-like protein with peptidoglycan-binding domain